LLEKAGMKNSSRTKQNATIDKFDALPDFLQVWPGHGAGSACGKL
jgi:hydroxyacylglutathione hydrolase